MRSIGPATLCASLFVALIAGGQPGLKAQDLTLEAVVERAGRYVTDFQRLLSGVVSEETYQQDVHDPATLGPRPALRIGVMHRELKSDLLLVRPQGADRWVQFRDVFEVDGKAVRDRNERLMKLFVEPTASTASQVDQIMLESSRYNIGNMQRTINVPLLALLILEPARRGHFKFAHARSGVPGFGRDLAMPPDTWTVSYDEVGPGTLIVTTNNRDLPSHGRFWIDPATGRVFMSELIASDVRLSGTVLVGYQPDVLADVLVPVAMHEEYLERRNNIRVSGTATYGRFRQFQVKVDEKIAPIKE
jgi:hypothetical protein